METLEEIKKQERKFYFRCSIGIAIGIACIALGWRMKGIVSAILVIGGGLIVLVILHTVSDYLDEAIRLRGLLREEQTGEKYRETYIDWPPWLKKWGWLLTFPILYLGFTFFAAMHENDFGGLRFVWHSLVAGLMFGLLIFYILRLRFLGWSDNKNKSIEIAFYLVILTMFIIVCFGPLINKSFGLGPVSCKQYRVPPDKSYKKGDKYIHLQTEKGKERFMPPPSFRRNLQTGDSIVILCVRKGGLGYEYVEEFKHP